MSEPSIVTLGCRLNHAESARIGAMLRGVDVAIVNTCAVTAAAMRDSRKAVRRAGMGGRRVIATGCAATIDPASFARIGAEVVPNAAKADWRAYSPSLSGEGLGWGLSPYAAPAGQLPPPSPPLKGRGGTHTRAFVPVQNGCDHSCTFCIIPQGRGPSRSRPVSEVIAEITELTEQGVAEVVLTGVDLTSYDAPSLGALVAAILRKVPALPRLRLSSLDGIEIDPLLFDLLTQEPRVMPHVHLSLQSGDDMVLKRMKRRHSRGQAIALVERLKSARPGIAIGADLIAGFPTETAEMHEANLSIIDACDVVHGHIFPYSPRPGTPAARMPQVDPVLVRERAAELRAAVAARRECWLAQHIGTRHAVLAERDGTGHAPDFARFALPAGTPPGAIVELTATTVTDGLLSA